MMLALNDVDKLVSEVASAALRGHKVARVVTEPALGSYGQDALRITLVLEGKPDIGGEVAIDAILGIFEALERDGDERMPIVHFVHEEWEADADPES